MELFENYSDYVETAETVSTEFYRKWKRHLPFVAKLFILSTYVEDSLRMLRQHRHQAEYFQYLWRMNIFFAYIFVFIVFITQLPPTVMLICKKFEIPSLISLFCNCLIQLVFYRMYSDFSFIARHMSLIGGLLLLYVSLKPPALSNEDMFGSLPPISEKFGSSQNYLQLFGRIMIVIMLLASIFMEEDWSSPLTWLRLAVDVLTIAAIVCGFKTHFSALFASVWLMLQNILVNTFWVYEANSHFHDYYKFEFFQNMSVVGSFMILVYIGPGDMSYDQKKKKW